MTVKERIKRFIASENVAISDFEKQIYVANGYVNSISKSIGKEKLEMILEKYPNLNLEWLLTGKGNMLKMPELMTEEEIQQQDKEVAEGKWHTSAGVPNNIFESEAYQSLYNKHLVSIKELETLRAQKTDTYETKKHLIPLYDDVATIGGNKSVANMDGVSNPSEYIDTGDWFTEATAAIRHYGESMVEYPTGCILALKEVLDRQLIIPGRDYMIETSEYRVTKRIQKGKDADHITAYSTNPEIYPDGRLVHEPFDIHWNSVHKIALVLGYVVKKNGGTLVYSNTK